MTSLKNSANSIYLTTLGDDWAPRIDRIGDEEIRQALATLHAHLLANRAATVPALWKQVVEFATEQLAHAQPAMAQVVHSTSSPQQQELSVNLAAPFGKSKEGPPDAAWVKYDGYYYSIEGGRSHKQVYKKFLEQKVGSRKYPTKEILNCTQGTPNPDRPGQETEERVAVYNHNKIQDDRAKLRPGTYADVAALMAARDACPSLRDKSGWKDLEPWTEGDKLHLIQGLDVEKVMDATGSAQIRVTAITINEFPLPFQDIKTKSELDLSGKGLGMEDASVIAAFIPLNVSAPLLFVLQQQRNLIRVGVSFSSGRYRT